MHYLLIEPGKCKVYFNYFFQTINKKFIIKYQQHPIFMRYVFHFKSKSSVENYVGNLFDNSYLKIDNDLIKKYNIQSSSWSWDDDNIFIEKTPANTKGLHKKDFFKNSILHAEDCKNEEIKKMFKNAQKNGYSNASDIMEAFGVEIISADSLIEYYEEITDCNNLNWKIIKKSYKNNNWQDDEILFQNLD